MTIEWVEKAVSILKSSGVYVGFAFLNRGLPFLLLPVLTSYIDPYGFGVIALLALIIRLLTPLIGMNSSTVLLQRFFLMDQINRSYYIGDAYKLILINTLLLVGSIYLSRTFFESLLGLPIGWLVIAILTASFGMGTALTTELFLLKKEAFKYGIFQTLSVFLTISSVIVFVVLLELSWEGRIFSLFLSSLILFLVSIYLGLKAQDISVLMFKKSIYFSSIIRLGLPLIPSAIGGWALAMTDRTLLTAMTSLEVVGIYAVGVMLAQIIDISLSSVFKTFYPYLGRYGKSTDIRAQVKLVQGMYVFTILCMVSLVAMLFVAPTLVRVMVDVRYHNAINVVGWLSLGYVFINIGHMFTTLLLASDQNTKLMYISTVTTLVGVGIAYTLINEYGMVGAAIGTAVTGFFSSFTLFIFCQMYCKLPWIDKRVFQF